MTLHSSCWPSYIISQHPLPQQKTLRNQTEASCNFWSFCQFLTKLSDCLILPLQPFKYINYQPVLCLDLWSSYIWESLVKNNNKKNFIPRCSHWWTRSPDRRILCASMNANSTMEEEAIILNHGGSSSIKKAISFSSQHWVCSAYLVAYKFNVLSAHRLCRHSLWSLLMYFWIYKRNDCYKKAFLHNV